MKLRRHLIDFLLISMFIAGLHFCVEGGLSRRRFFTRNHPGLIPDVALLGFGMIVLSGILFYVRDTSLEPLPYIHNTDKVKQNADRFLISLENYDMERLLLWRGEYTPNLFSLRIGDIFLLHGRASAHPIYRVSFHAVVKGEKKIFITDIWQEKKRIREQLKTKEKAYVYIDRNDPSLYYIDLKFTRM